MNKVLERTVRKLFQTAHGQRFVAKQRARLGGRDGLRLRVKAQGAQ